MTKFLAFIWLTFLKLRRRFAGGKLEDEIRYLEKNLERLEYGSMFVLALARRHYNRCYYVAAVNLCESHFDRVGTYSNPFDLQIKYALAHSLDRAKLYDKALPCWKDLYDLKSELKEGGVFYTTCGLGRAYLRLRDFGKAIPLLRRALSYESGSYWTFCSLMTCYVESSLYDEASDLLIGAEQGRVLQTDKRGDEWRRKSTQEGTGETENAAPFLDRTDTQGVARADIGRPYTEGDFDSSLLACEKVIAADPSDDFAWMMKLLNQIMKREFVEARSTLEHIKSMEDSA